MAHSKPDRQISATWIKIMKNKRPTPVLKKARVEGTFLYVGLTTWADPSMPLLCPRRRLSPANCQKNEDPTRKAARCGVRMDERTANTTVLTCPRCGGRWKRIAVFPHEEDPHLT